VMKSAQERVWIQTPYVVLDAAMRDSLRAAAEQEVRIPQELSLLSLDDEYPLDQLPVPVAAISAPPRKMGETAAELLLKLLDNRLPPEERCVKAAGRLMRRKSVISRN